MCTVSYIPTKSGFILTSNRDEKPKRNSSKKPHYTHINDKKILCPKNNINNGTWIATDGENFSLCLFNGGYKKHLTNAPYKESRGNIIAVFYTFYRVIDFATRYDFAGIEPFSLVVVIHKPKNLWLFVWDGKNANLQQLSYRDIHLWSSATLYSREIHKRKTTAFMHNIEALKSINQEIIISIHKNTKTGNKENNFIMERNCGIQTLSISSVQHKIDKTYFYHENLLNNSIYYVTFNKN